ncbi:AAA-domain-containing protein, partial [Rozella allomycis CSF55]
MYVITTCITVYFFNQFLQPIKQQQEKYEEAKKNRKKLFKKLGVPDMALNSHEEIIANEVVDPEDIKDSFEDIGGLDDIIDELKESVLLPLCRPELFQQAGLSIAAPKGVLLQGPPAKEANARFINIRASTLMDKYLGESEKLVHALFSLATKIQPSIIFIDEIDALLRDRQSKDHEVVAIMKTEMMSLWDGLMTGNSRVVILGATNRPNDIDSAFQRRLSKRIVINLPNQIQRKEILKKLLQGASLHDDVDIDEIAKETNLFSGSDLKEF